MDDPSGIPCAAAALTSQTVRDAVERLRTATYRPIEHPPIHPGDYAAAKAWRGGDEPLTVADYYRWRARA